jgi:peptide-methionine (S)-S-oxide reductase
MSPVIALLAAACSAEKAPAQPAAAERASAVFAGGCFWCTEADFDKIPGVIATTSGYTGGRVANPNYKQVSAGGTGHIEAVRVVYDPKRVSYAQLVRRFLPTIDVTDGGGQFCDRGESYRPAIFVANAEERRTAQAALKQVDPRVAKPIAVAVLPAARFWPAEGYHQDYYTKNPTKYKFYRWNCGRDKRLKEVWG